MSSYIVVARDRRIAGCKAFCCLPSKAQVLEALCNNFRLIGMLADRRGQPIRRTKRAKRGGEGGGEAAASGSGEGSQYMNQ